MSNAEPLQRQKPRQPTRARAKGRKESNTSFAGIPRVVMQHPDYKNLSGNAVKLLNALAYQFKGQNNGDLTAAYTVMEHDFGFRSKGTLNRALKELLAADLILMTRVGMFMNPGGRCALYALTWLPIDECKGKLDAAPTIIARRNFARELGELRKQSAQTRN